MKTVKEAIIEAIEKEEGYTPTEDEVIESIVECGEEVWAGDKDEHRWYILEEVVHRVYDKFVRFDKYVITGDSSMGDMGLEYDLNDFELVETKERVTVEVYYE